MAKYKIVLKGGCYLSGDPYASVNTDQPRLLTPPAWLKMYISTQSIRHIGDDVTTARLVRTQV